MNCGLFTQCFPQSHSPLGAESHDKRAFRLHAFEAQNKEEEKVQLVLYTPIVTYGMTFRRTPSHSIYWCQVDKVEVGTEAEQAGVLSGAVLVELGRESMKFVQYNDVLAKLKRYQADATGELILVFTQSSQSPTTAPLPASGPRWPVPGVTAFIPLGYNNPEDNASRPRTNSTMTQFWMSDQHAKCCVACDELFTFCRRRHHCRSCGQIFCSNCCHRLPLSFKPRDVSMQWLRNQLVCHPCHRQLKEGLLRQDPPLKSKSLPLPPPTTAKLHKLSSLQPPNQSPPIGEQLQLSSSIPDEHNQFLQDINPLLYAMFPKAHMRMPAVPATTAGFNLKSNNPPPMAKVPSLRRSDSEPDLLRRVRFAVEETPTESRRRLHSRASIDFADNQALQDGNFQLSKACANAVDIPDILSAHQRNQAQMSDDATAFVLDRLVTTMEKRNFSQLSLADQCAFIDILLQLSTQAAASVEDGVAGCRIKCFPGGAPSDSFLVSGVLLRKRVARKTMRKVIENPRVLVVASALDYHKEKESFSPLELVAGLETEYMRIAAEKIKRLRPDIVVFQKHVHRVAEECLAADNIVVVKNIKEEDLRRIAKVTHAAILSAFDHVDKMQSDAILGSCSRFRVWTPDPPEPNVDDTKPDKKLSKKHCIVFETNEPAIGVTLCLRGAKSKSVLMDLRDIVLQSVHLAYHLRLQRSLWSAWGIAPTSKNAIGTSSFDSMYLKLRDNSLSMRASIKMQQMKCTSCKTIERKARATAARRRSSESLNLQQSPQPCSCPKDIIAPHWPFQIVVSVCWSRLDMRTPSVAEWNVLQFYNTDSDCSLGQFLSKQYFDSAPSVYRNAFKTHRLTFTHDMARIHFRVLSKPTQPTRKKGAGETLMDMVNFAKAAVQTNTTPITWIAHAATSSPVYSELTPEMQAYSFGKFLEDLIYMKPLSFDAIYPDLEDITADRCVRYFAFCDVVVSVSIERIEPVLHVALRPSLWDSFQPTSTSPSVEDLRALADEVKSLTIQKIDESINDLNMLQQHLQLTKVPKSKDELAQLKSHVRFWHTGFTEKLRQNPPTQLFTRHALFKEIYDHAAKSCMRLRDSSSTQSTFKIETNVDQAASTALPLGWFQGLPKHQQPSPTAMFRELDSSQKKLSIDTTATAADFVQKIQSGEIPREQGFNAQSLGVAFPDIVDIASEPSSLTTGSANLSQSESWNRTWVVGSDIPKSKSTVSHFLELPQSILSWHPSLPLGKNQVVVLVNATQPTSVVAYSLMSVDYNLQLKSWFEQDNRSLELLNEKSRHDLLAVLRSDRRSNIDHLFVDESEFQSATKFGCKSFYATQFHALRQLSDYDENRFVESLCRCETWEVSGGKSGAGFMKSKDERFIAKVIPSNQLQMFLNLAPKYFEYMAKSIEENAPTMLSRIVGVYRVTIAETNMSLLVMENLVYGRQVDVLFDLKGKMEGRTADENDGAVLWDRNFVKMFKGIPMPLQESAMALLKTAMTNDTTFLASIDIVDYSMLVGYDRQKQEVVACIIDYIVKYDLLKRLEHHGKRLLQDEDEITVLNPKQYTKRFQTAMTKYFTPIPSRYSSVLPRQDED